MKDWERKCITTNKSALCDAINLKDGKILAALETAEILTEDESDLVSMHLPLRIKANNEMLNLLMKRTKGYEELMKILADLKQDKAYNILKTCKEKCEPKDNKEQQESVAKQIKSLEDEVDGPDPIKKVVVKRPDKHMNFEKDYYRLPVKGKGLVLLINVIIFNRLCRKKTKQLVDIKPRASARRDTENLISLFSEIGYEIYKKDIILKKEVWTANEIKAFVEKFKAHCNQTDVASTVVFVGSHGKDGMIFGSDWKPVFIKKDIVNKYNTENCEKLLNKPKIFIIQACQRFEDENDEDDDMHGDEDDEPYTPNFDNYGVVKATISGFPAKRNTDVGSILVHFLTKALMENAHYLPFKKIIKLVNDNVKQYEYEPLEAGKFQGGQVIEADLLQLKKLYFNLEPEYP
ncbi:Caspase-2 [Orchesella cincta]|uniref:Caspase-2 n=1 Tax=Orchesella cincta TaxID=48709 RepID=A0A1D2M9N5_ORCCI|nr:Caspase-2 [Orchesella cincta]